MLTQFEFEESRDRERTSFANLEETLSRAEDVFASATSLAGDQAWTEWQHLPEAAKIAESEFRDAAAKRIERRATSDFVENTDAELSLAFHRWNVILQQLLENSRTALISRIAAEVQHLR